MRTWNVSDVMSRAVVTAHPEMSYKAVADLLVSKMISAVPVVDDDGRVVGVVSEADLLPKIEYADRVPHHPLAVRRMSHLRRQTAGVIVRDAMTAPAITIAEDATLVDAARRLDAARVKRLPVVDSTGRLVGIVSRRDVVRLYTRPDEVIQGEVIDALCAAFGTELTGLGVHVHAGRTTLSGVVPRRSSANLAEGHARAVPGVVSVINNIEVLSDDAVKPAAAALCSFPVA
jgi:CBS domain-containing protein